MIDETSNNPNQNPNRNGNNDIDDLWELIHQFNDYQYINFQLNGQISRLTMAMTSSQIKLDELNRKRQDILNRWLRLSITIVEKLTDYLGTDELDGDEPEPEPEQYFDSEAFKRFISTLDLTKLFNDSDQDQEEK